MTSIPKVIQELTDLLSALPGIGKKSAQRICFYLMDRPREEIVRYAKGLIDLKDKITHCPICHFITEETPCVICRDPKRDKSVLCVVEDSLDVISIEKTAAFHGKYHVLGGLISPLDGIGPEDLSIDQLVERLDDVEEIILAVNPSVEGDTTAYYLQKIISRHQNIRMTSLARGIPVGGDLEFTDEATLTKALEGRSEMNGRHHDQ
ncbi:MAG: recombination protein RecR [Candidatus Neomarinimicrobiota bacterium]|mgnify:CR=1 FL=1|nr:recombination protein RecR [Candidatus Neomarinimicrobiota bacterium]RKY47357.1 MAG: recombination protein RecR [Candidatus Neomarinimicrobiota bacterium]